MLQVKFFWVLILCVLIDFGLANAQTRTVYGVITDTTGKVLPYASIAVPALSKGVTADSDGKYLLNLPQGRHQIQFSLIGFRTETRTIETISSQKLELNISLRVEVKSLEEVSVVERNPDISRISVKEFGLLPNPSNSLEALIKTLPGVSSANELSSQYSVRGGNFDENLVYVNDVEVIRPFLIRSGQQEGLSFINPDLTGSIRFSAGGFEARYGDKMSSVLDVTYRTPQKTASSVNLSFMGGSIAVEGISKSRKLSFLSGFRYKTTRLLLGSLDSKGEYEPNFIDWQMLLNYKAGEKLSFGLFTNYALNSYKFIPQTRTTSFGTFANIYNLKIYYDGREDDQYNSMMGSGWAQYQVNSQLRMKVMLNATSMYEQEKFDISGEYLINELDAYPGSDSYGDSILNLGVGAMLNHARNYLQADIWSATYSGNWQVQNHSLSWAVKYQHDKFRDRLSEWDYIDSAGYSAPYSDREIALNNIAAAENHLTIERYSAFIQDVYKWSISGTAFSLNTGVRLHAWSLTSEILISPRVRFSVQPNWTRDIVFYAASGIYYQPPVYKELRNSRGELNKHIKSQQSVHILLGSEIMLNLWERPFKYTVETYYKDLKNLIPYKLDNVRIKYTAQNNAKGYATGIDMKLYGEFVPGVESWASLSLLSTKEDLKDDYYISKSGERIEPGYYHRPTDQLFHINLFFQDYFPNQPSLKASLNLVFGTSFHVAPPRTYRFDATYPLGNYRRVDLGLSKTFKTASLPWLKNFWIGMEVFNLFDIRNKASFMWIQTVANQENVPNLFAVPNYLTSRRINLKLSAKF